jgi:hypothetical protein
MQLSSQLTALALALAAGAAQAGGGVPVAIDADADRHPISPLIYGVAFGSAAQVQDLGATLNRAGGTAFSRYNWQADSVNSAEDYFYESHLQGNGAPAGWYDGFVGATRPTGAQVVPTVPMIDWVSRLGTGVGSLASFSVAKYGAQTQVDPNWPDAGNGVLLNGTPITWNDENDASTPNSVALQQGFVQHLVTQWGPAVRGGVRYYGLDNEPTIWFSQHADVAAVGLHDTEAAQKMIDYAAAIKAVDGAALVLGPEEWGWDGFRFSGYDQQWLQNGGAGTPPDYAARGPYSPYLLQRLAQAHGQGGRRLLDVFTLHYYPQGGEFCWPTPCGLDVATQLRRNRSTRELWDPAYVSESWIGQPVRLLPLMKEWVAAHYPGTRVGLTEYNWGAEGHVNGATAQADVLGILGREGAHMAIRWTTPPTGSPAYNAFKLVRNHDGARRSFGDVSVRAQTADPDTLAAFAALRTSDGALTVLIVAKALQGTQDVALTLANFAHGGAAQVFQLGAGNVIQQLPDLVPAGNALALTVPFPSVTLLVVPAAQPLVARGDFDGDAQADIVFRHAQSGTVRLWLMNGVERSAATDTTPPAEDQLEWTVVGTNDFSGDRRNDLLWRHGGSGALRVWAMDGALRTGVLDTSPAAVPDLNWKVVGTGDFDGDGQADLAWRHALSGRNVVWLMDGTERVAGAFLNPDTVADTNWLIAGVADMNSDGANDLVWRHRLSGNVVIWLMDGLVRVTGLFADPPSLTDPSWELAGVGDFSRDGQPDLLWHHRVSGRNVVWFMDGTRRVFGVYTSPDAEAGASWQVVGPR